MGKTLTYSCGADCTFKGRYIERGQSLSVDEAVVPSRVWQLTHVNGKRATKKQRARAERRFAEYQAVMADKLEEKYGP